MRTRAETYEQPILSFGDGKHKNIYSYLRSKNGYGGECNLISAPLNYRASITHLLTFVHLMDSQQPDWLSRDLVVLFYEQSDYQMAVKEFLDAYYHNGMPSLHGRCGYLRQSFPLVIKDHDFNKVSLMIEGVNSQLSDIDFYDQLRLAVKGTNKGSSLSYDVTLPNYFKKNSYLVAVLDTLAPLYDAYFAVLGNILELLDMKLTLKASIFPLLDSLRNSFMGRLQHPHSYFMDVGCHAITFVTHGGDLKPFERATRL